MQAGEARHIVADNVPLFLSYCVARSKVEELRMMLDVDGDGLITLQEMLEAIKEAFAARKSFVRVASTHLELTGLLLQAWT